MLVLLSLYLLCCKVTGAFNFLYCPFLLFLLMHLYPFLFSAALLSVFYILYPYPRHCLPFIWHNWSHMIMTGSINVSNFLHLSSSPTSLHCPGSLFSFQCRCLFPLSFSVFVHLSSIFLIAPFLCFPWHLRPPPFCYSVYGITGRSGLTEKWVSSLWSCLPPSKSRCISAWDKCWNYTTLLY